MMLSNSSKLFLSHHFIVGYAVFTGLYLVKEIIHKCEVFTLSFKKHLNSVYFQKKRMSPLSEFIAVFECFLSSFVSGLYDTFLVAL